MLVDQHAVVRRDDRAALPADGGPGAQNRVLERQYHIRVRAVVLKVLL